MRGMMPVVEERPTADAAPSHVIDMDRLSPQELQLPPVIPPNAMRDGVDHSSPELQFAFTLCQKYLPFVLILLLKLIFDHRVGILVMLGLLITFCHNNAIVKRQVAEQNLRNLLLITAIQFNLAFCIFLVYVVLEQAPLIWALVLVPPYTTPQSLWEVLWIVAVTDFVIKLLTILLKCVVLALPYRFLISQKKGNYFLFLESVSQMYRCIVPVPHWLFYFFDSYSGASKVFGVILSASYLVSKWRDLISKGHLLKKAVWGFLHNVNYGVTPTKEQLKSAGAICPICQDSYKTPTMLYCKHVFCENCVAMWFDRERTCPMCRAEIAHDPSWRDGTTSPYIQLM